MTGGETRATAATASRRLAWALLAVVAGIAAWTFLAPHERTLGSGIRLVYLHAASTRAGQLGILSAGLLGVLATARDTERWARWLRAGGLVAILLFVAGLLLSLVAAQVNWGGVLWAEPRVMASVRVIAATAAAHLLLYLPVARRWTPLAWTAAAAYAVFAISGAGLLFHPRQPVQATTPWGMQAAFAGIFALTVFAGALATAWIGRQEGLRRESEPG